jgi:hypothetical protein
MKKTVTLLSLSIIVLLSTSAYIIKSSNGIAGQTGAPGENNCGAGGCHSGGTSASKGVTVSATPSFTNDQYMADSTYLITVQVAATGFSRFGFGCEILDSLNVNAGTMQNAGAGVKFLNAGPRLNAVHTGPKFGTNGTTFTFKWVAPPEGRVNFYVCANAVNLNNNTSGDLPMPFYMFVYPAPIPEDTVVIIDNISTHKMLVNDVVAYPNPMKEFGNLSYTLLKNAKVEIQLINLQGVLVKEVLNEKQATGNYSRIINVKDISSGIYFLKFSADGEKVSQKLITIE